MESISQPLEILGLPSHVECWSAATIPGFIAAVFSRWNREQGQLPPNFVLITCPLVEINAIGGLPSRVRELTNPRLRFQHFTGCHKPYTVILLVGEDAEARREEIQKLLSWSEGYRVELGDNETRLWFIDAVEERDDAVGYD